MGRGTRGHLSDSENVLFLDLHTGHTNDIC